MPDRRVLRYGSWPSPVTIDMAVAASTSLREPRLDGDDVYWIEGRPEEGGRQVIVRRRDGATSDVIPQPFNARNMVHEYGGGVYAVGPNDTVYFTNLADGRIYAVVRSEMPVALTQDGSVRYADLVFDAPRSRILCIREDHTDLIPGELAETRGRVREPVNTLVAVDAASGEVSVLASGYDFYSSARVSPDGDQIAWLAWRHPNMPWDSTELWLADVDPSGGLRNERMIAGGPSESVLQPEWAPDGTLVFISDRSGWWNLYRWTALGDIVPLREAEAEFGGPQWVFGMRWYAIAPDGTIYAVAHESGASRVCAIPVEGDARHVDLGDEEVGSIQAGDGGRLCYVSGSWSRPPAVVTFDVSTGRRDVLKTSFELEVDEGYLAAPEEIDFPTTNGAVAHALYFRPTNRDCAGPEDERPPLIVMSHGGPTSSASGSLDMERDLFTSRGFAVVDVNYRGSNGYGRDYLRSLDGNWGVYDVDDCIAAVRFLAARGDVDGERVAIRGGSAGGYTTLAALTFSDVFAAGASHYGVGDLEALARETHKFESRYLDRLVAPYPEAIDLYRERSPIHHVDELSSPLIVLQGVDDNVVPVAQAEQMVDALRARQIPHAYLRFEGEGHGFRQAANIRRALEAELSFYAQVFGFTLADDFEPVAVENLAPRKR